MSNSMYYHSLSYKIQLQKPNIIIWDPPEYLKSFTELLMKIEESKFQCYLLVLFDTI